MSVYQKLCLVVVQLWVCLAAAQGWTHLVAAVQRQTRPMVAVQRWTCPVKWMVLDLQFLHLRYVSNCDTFRQ